MAETTPERVKALAQEFSAVSDSDVNMYIDDAVLELEDYSFDEKYREKLERYLAAHYLSLSVRETKREEIDDLTKEYNVSSKDPNAAMPTRFGLEFERILKKTTGGTFMLFS